jgi:phosphate transport system permease protein
MLLLLIGSLLQHGYRGFTQTEIRLSVNFDPAILELEKGDDVTSVTSSTHQLLVKATLRKMFPEVTDAQELKQLYALFSVDAGRALKATLNSNPALLAQSSDVWVTASSMADLFVKGVVSEATAEQDRSINNKQIGWLKAFTSHNAVRTVFNKAFFTRGDSRSPEQAGFLGAMLGSAYTLIMCLLVAFPLGVMTAVYLEEFAKKGKWVDIIEVNINNLAAVPSIVFGLLGLEIYINILGLPRSSPVVGGLTLALMILPVIIITTRVALTSIPRTIRDAARALGATPVQVVWHHVLPLAMPGVMTGTILGMARAIGETAPLIMIGMVAFVADVPDGFTTSATVMPVQIYLWASSPDGGFVEKTAAGILVLLMLLLSMNAIAIYLRKRFEVRW